MSRRTPLMKAEATGRILHDPARFKGRKEPPSKGPLGEPPAWLKKKGEREAWTTLRGELPWLNHSHRALVSIASTLLGRLMDGEELSVNALNLVRLCLSQMGASPVDASKITLPDDEDEVEDPAAKYF
jgi:hypothetical protein